jgi:hypothetical protein
MIPSLMVAKKGLSRPLITTAILLLFGPLAALWPLFVHSAPHKRSKPDIAAHGTLNARDR